MKELKLNKDSLANLLDREQLFSNLSVNSLIHNKPQSYKSIVEQTNDLICIINAEGIIHYASPSYQDVLGYSHKELVQQQFKKLIHPENLSSIPIYNNQILLHNHRIDVQMVNSTGEYRWFELNIDPIYTSEGNIGQYIMIARDIDERKKLQLQVEKLAFFDALTKIPNRRLFEERLAKCYEKARQNHTKFAILYLDCDNFKNINDTFGHDTGDQFLIEFVQRVKQCLRESDTFARTGGDEFSIIVEDFNENEQINQIASRILHSLKKEWHINGNVVKLTSSIGIALYPENSEHIHSLLNYADIALYRAKENGRNKHQFFTEELAMQMSRTNDIELGLKDAIKLMHFHLVFQPQINTQTNHIVCVEVLLRYNNPKFGNITPGELFQLGGRMGLSEEITNWVLNEALKQQQTWRNRGYGDIPISINISSVLLKDKQFLKEINHYFKYYETNPNTIEIELMEESLLDNIELIMENLLPLKKLGVKITLDNFGIGNASIKYISELAIDKVKIDKSYVQQLSTNPKVKSIMKYIILLLHSLGIEVVCEGIESKRQLEQVENCYIMQGYYFSKPLPANSFEKEWLG
ncbi:EAL domain-containing protein [Gracilibacillus xinjiangensis]|uniref:EAL domain-containing protein n=1 Tax=Gracilibacillus xinjiangensis TaxID=1193282 RepID=A0ABV8WYF4_9BACI